MLILHLHHHEITTNRTSSLLIDLGEQENIEIDFQAEDYDCTVSKSAYSIADIQDLGCLLGQQLSKSQQLPLYIAPLCLQHIEAEYWIKWLSFGLALANYRYQHQPTATLSTSITQYQLETSNTRWQQAFNEGKVLALSQLTARELINKPGNVLYPESFVSAVEQLALSGVTLSVLDDITMQEQGFGGLMGVSQGSNKAPRLLTLEYTPANPSCTIALVGKGVTFDSGGISLKQPSYMSTMKTDMAGAAAVVGAIQAISALQLPVHVIGLCGLVENMPSSQALKPGDVVTMLSGKSVEIITTDAEGRMVLADVLHYAQQQYQPDYLIDIATLTGAAGIALGKAYAAVMGNDEELIKQAQRSGLQCFERLWPLPIDPWYQDILVSDYADYRHGGETPDGSPCVAATFLAQFIQPQQKWIHIDCAAMTFQPQRKLYSKASTGFGTLLLTQLCEHIAKDNI
ncbi:M17 family metallopeptidase [Photobacterium damselae]|uniref:M17 family metallopeptidase n=1 Tax=Photobacterium damselae TaxID=38293 RepID=UPI003D7C79E6